MANKYDIFISYRSEDGAQYARILQMQLEKTGYRVFLDYDELKRNRFGDDISLAIKSAPIFLMVLTPLYLERCKEDGNWIKREIDLAIEENRHFVPINPDRRFKGVPDGVGAALTDVVENYQHSIIDFGPTLKVTFDLMVKNQIRPIVKPRFKIKMWWMIFFTCLIVLMISALIGYQYYENFKLSKMRTDMEKKYSDFGLKLSRNLTALQMATIDDILDNMQPIKYDSLWISKFEFTCGWWYGIYDETCSEDSVYIPVTGKSFGDIFMFIGDLAEKAKMTNFSFSLPSVEEWQSAARGGEYNDSTVYAGSNNIEDVAWYKRNSEGHVHPNDQKRKDPNRLDLFDMCGNVAELCNGHFEGGLCVAYGGDFNSPASETMITSYKEVDMDAKEETIGFRLVIRR